MALPSGYTKLDYIESSGTQYINTGFKPNQNTRCVMDIENLSSAQAAFFGARANQNAASFTYFSLTATTGRSDYGSSKQSMSFTNTVGRYTVDQNKNVCTANGVTATGTANTFQLTNNLYLMAVNQADAAIQNAKLKLYSAKVYDNGTLVRDFIPCKNASGTIGLWDNVNSVFYANAGTGTFSTGTKHKTLIDGTGYEIKSGRVLIAGTGYDIKKGRTLIGGTGYNISFGQPISNLPVGSIVNLEHDGALVPHIVVHQGLPSNYYDASCNGTWLIRKDIAALSVFLTDSSGGVPVNGGYTSGTCTARKYVENTYYPKYSDKVKQCVKTIKMYDLNHSTKCFLLQSFEASTTWVYPPSGGASFKATLDYFTNDTRRIANYNGSATAWWLADIDSGHGPYVYPYYITSTGDYDSWSYASDQKGIRPTIIFDFESLVSISPDSNGIYGLE